MMKSIKRAGLQVSAAIFIGTVSGVESAFAQTTGGTGNTFSTISRNVSSSISELPGLLTGVSYMMGILLGVLGILKIKDHVENPGNTPLQHGAIRLAAGGGLFALPIVYESMLNTIGADGQVIDAAAAARVDGFSNLQ
jgi:hypothetical protein